MPGTINIIAISAPLPEGWEGTPDEFRQEVFSTLQFQANGAFLTGQIGGALPTVDVGLFVDGRDLYTWDADSSAYRPVRSVPVGTVSAYLGAVAPTNYLLLDGGDYLQTDYPELFALIGTTFNRVGDASNRFRVPNAAGRTFIGAGIGDYNPKLDGTPGRMKEILLGEYGGREWPVRKTTRHVQQPANNATPGDSLIYSGTRHATLYTRSVPPYIAGNWIVRAL